MGFVRAMAPRRRSLSWPLLALLASMPGACAPPPVPDRATAALRAALASSQDSLAVLACGSPRREPPAQPGPVPCRADRIEAEAGLRPAGFTPYAAPRPEGVPPATAAELLGAGPEVLRRRLGEPALRRIEGTAEIWLYAGPACALDLVLYPERGGGGGLRVAHAAARAAGAENRTESECLRELGRASPGAAAVPGGRDA